MTNTPYRPPEGDLPPDTAYLLTPEPPAEPRINGPRVYGSRPGRPFLLSLAVTGTRPLRFQADGLPATLSLDAESGRITGTVNTPGTYLVTLKVDNASGRTEGQVSLVIGDTLALTPPMGWNSWNCWSHNVSAENVRASAQAMATSGLADHGWTYINIDDAWQGRRCGPHLALQPNEKFPDLKGLCDDIHALGLKAGIYSTPWVTTYAGFNGGSSDTADGAWQKIEGYENYKQKHYAGPHRFEKADAAQWAAWGFDYLKYDWNPNDAECVTAMGQALVESGRDIVYSLSNTAPFELAEVWKAHAHCWRTTGDIRDAWSRADLPPQEQWSLGLIDIAQQHERWAPFNGPGHWCDADMLVVGRVGWGTLRDNHLKPDELYTHFSLWCLWSSPLLIGCPLDDLDPFTKNLLTNDEVIAVNQDALGVQARRVSEGDHEVWVKPMEGGSVVAGFFNKGPTRAVIRAEAPLLGQTGEFRVRDLWRQKDLGLYNDFACEVRPHGVVLVRIWPKG